MYMNDEYEYSCCWCSLHEFLGAKILGVVRETESSCVCLVS